MIFGQRIEVIPSFTFVSITSVLEMIVSRWGTIFRYGWWLEEFIIDVAQNRYQVLSKCPPLLLLKFLHRVKKKCRESPISTGTAVRVPGTHSLCTYRSSGFFFITLTSVCQSIFLVWNKTVTRSVKNTLHSVPSKHYGMQSSLFKFANCIGQDNASSCWPSDAN